VEAAIRACCRRVFGSDSLRGRSVCVVGLGHVGGRVARRCARAGAQLLVSDVDSGKRALAASLGARWVAPDRAFAASAEVLAPCALGGVLNEETVPQLRCAIVAGAANNQLTDERIADLMAARGVLWAPDFVVNAGGLINIACEFVPDGYSAARARASVRAIGGTLRDLFAAADAAGATPLTAAMEVARRRLAAG
jgi:leucine dehydrogenase